MRKIFTLTLLCVSLIFGGFAADAKKYAKKGRAKTTATATAIKKDAAGHVILTGHVYKANLQDGTSYTLTFKSGGVASLKLSAGGRSQTAPGQWEQQGNTVGVYDEYSGSLVLGGLISPDGRSIDCQSMYGEDMNFKLVR